MSHFLIMILCGIAWLLTLINVVPVYAALSMSASFLLLDLLGVFKKDKAALEEKLQEQNKQIKQLKEVQEELEKTKAVVYLKDDDGEESTIEIYANGRIETTGKPDPKIIEAVRDLKESINRFGPAAVVQEINKRLAEDREDREDKE